MAERTYPRAIHRPDNPSYATHIRRDDRTPSLQPGNFATRSSHIYNIRQVHTNVNSFGHRGINPLQKVNRDASNGNSKYVSDYSHVSQRTAPLIIDRDHRGEHIKRGQCIYLGTEMSVESKLRLTSPSTIQKPKHEPKHEPALSIDEESTPIEFKEESKSGDALIVAISKLSEIVSVPQEIKPETKKIPVHPERRKISRAMPLTDVSKLRDVHMYDGKITKEIEVKKEGITADDKRLMFSKLITLLSSDTSKKGAEMIMNDIQTPRNYSYIDDKFADDILGELCILSEEIGKPFRKKYEELLRKLAIINEKIDVSEMIISNDIIKSLSEQLEDIITLGHCPQGRVNRLFSVLFSYRGLRIG